MQVKPVLSKAPPQYPTHDFLQEHPELLRIVPERWRRNPLVLRVLAGVGCLLLAAQSAAAQERTGVPASRVAPLFAHGEGRGAGGCVMVNPPVFLAEDEALQVIRHEAKKAGLDFTAEAPTVLQATVPVTSLCGRRVGTQKRDLVFDGFDKEHNVAFEFVSDKHFDAWGDGKPCTLPLYFFDMKGTAGTLRTGLVEAPGLPWVGVFYEPGADPDRHFFWEGRERAGRREGKADLREQVHDFIKWLKAQGVI
jgi:hypothetical protein